MLCIILSTCKNSTLIKMIIEYVYIVLKFPNFFLFSNEVRIYLFPKITFNHNVDQ